MNLGCRASGATHVSFVFGIGSHYIAQAIMAILDLVLLKYS